MKTRLINEAFRWPAAKRRDRFSNWKPVIKSLGKARLKELVMPKRRWLRLTEPQLAELIAARDHDKRPFVRERCAALVKVAQGQSAHRVAQEGLLKVRDPDTIYHWLDIYQQEGLAGLMAHQQGGYQGRHL
jgi:hypothetical protein